MVKYYAGERDIREEKSPRFCVLALGIFRIGLGDFSYLASHLCAVRVILIRLQVFYVYWSERTA